MYHITSYNNGLTFINKTMILIHIEVKSILFRKRIREISIF